MIYLVVALLAAAAWIAWMQLQRRNMHVISTTQRINPRQYLSDFTQKPHLLLDVRTPEEFAGGHIEGAVNIALQSLSQRLPELPTDRPVVIYCRSGNRSATAAHLLTRAGYHDLYDLGGIIAWQAQGLPIR